MSVKRLWTFGDSFTSDPLMSNYNYSKYVEISGNQIVTWPHILGGMLDCVTVNKATQGSSNYQTFQDFCRNSHSFNTGDIVIVGWGLVQKFKWADDKNLDGFRSVHPNDVRMNYTEGTFFDIAENRKSKIWREEIYDWENLMLSFAKAKGVELYTWANEDLNLYVCETEEFKASKKHIWLLHNVDKPLIHYLKNVGAKTMTDETNGQVQDFHMGLNGHNVQAKLFYNDIQDKKGKSDSKVSKILEIGKIEDIDKEIFDIEKWIDDNKSLVPSSFWTYYKAGEEIDTKMVGHRFNFFPEDIKNSVISVMEKIKNKFNVAEIWFTSYAPGEGLGGFHFDPVPLRHIVALNSHHKFYSYEVLNGTYDSVEKIKDEFDNAKKTDSIEEFNSDFKSKGNVVQNFKPGNIYSFTTSGHHFHNSSNKSRIAIVFDLL
jgi:hypothetical protein